MTKGNTVMLAVLVALGVTLVAGLIAIPTIERAHATTLTNRIQGFLDTGNSLICSFLGGSGCGPSGETTVALGLGGG